MAPIARKPKGWLFPGYKYLGPFNPLDNGEPVNKADSVAREHDLAYSKYLEAGKNPYLNFNKADQKFIDDLKGDSSIGGFVGKSVFTLKKHLFPHLKEVAPPSKKPRTDSRAEKRKLYFARSNKPAKQPKMSNDGSSMEGASDQTEGAGRSRVARSAGGGYGGHGVGVSTGGWVAGSIFTDTVVITTNTRQWYAPIYDGHKYKQIIASDNGATGSDWLGMATPWGFFNFNCYASHFSPQDWQRLTNEYKKWRPVKMTVKLYNLQIKQIVNLGNDILYNNDLTAGVHILCDGSHKFPYSQHAWDTSTMPELPYEIWKLPQYAYYQTNADLDTKTGSDAVTNPHLVAKNIKFAQPLYILESEEHAVLRTGEDASFNFSFECGWVHNDRCYCPPQADFNPLTNTRRYYPSYEESTQKYSFSRYNPYKKPSSWFPGPGMNFKGIIKPNSGANTGKTTGPISVVYQPPYTTSRNAQATAQSHSIAVPNLGGIRVTGYNVAPTNGACSTIENVTLAYDSAPQSEEVNAITQVDTDYNMSRYGSVWWSNSTEEKATGFNSVWMYPMQAWDGIPISRYTPIWVKIPRTDFHTILDSPDGTLPMKHPPGNIFCKVAKIPIPTSNNADSFLNIYVTGQVTCEIVWEVERYATKNWRPEPKNDPNSWKDATIYNIDKTGKYNTPENFREEMPTRMGINKVL
ncbi:VP1 [Canine bocavirus 3]|uniref:Minor capsid protein VP1 n=1 Tax=Canine bocavirus 3 TaxID=1295080 RepID=M1NNZ2_9VIRU|nr:VP1 [Canine bocavirus 3]AGF85785.1 VP1 [Canine bocavirus 3]